MVRAVVVVALLLAGGAATAAPPRVIRMATVAPDGTSWAREIRAFARDVENATNGEVHVKLYFGGIAGGETEMEEQIRRGHLDGMVSGGMFCSRVAPTLRVLRVLGLLHDRQEAIYLINRLRSTISRESEHNGFVDLGIALVGMDLLFSRRPVRTLADLRRGAFWLWDLDDMVEKQLREMGVHLVMAPLPDAAGLYESARSDGFLTVPGAALAFQWSAQAKYAAPLAYAALPGCAVVTTRVFDELPFETRQAIRGAGAKLQARFDDVTTVQDASLLGELFARQGLVFTPVDERFRAEFFGAAAEAARRLGSQLVPPALLQQATHMLDERRAQPSH
ncbi:MAG: TRAP transporter substrate-binding protein DctP [Polyangia bacterium]